VVVIGVAVAIIFAQAWRASSHIMFPSAPHYAWNLADYPALASVVEPLTVRSSTGVTLVGRFFPGRSGATIVLSHGYGGDEDEMLPVANTLHAAGFTVVTYNERGRDGSGGSTSMGPLEATDLRSVIDAVVRHPHVNPNEVGAFGFSLGSDITILEAAGDRRVKAVAVDGSAPYLTAYRDASLSDIVLDPTTTWTPLSAWLLELRTGANLADNRAAAVVRRISPRPILFIQGLADTAVKPWETIDTFHHASKPRELWLVSHEGHDATVAPGGAATSTRVAAFFARALLHTCERVPSCHPKR
jgi:pimeloyl-ACP methyl ester carboxylesterase